MSVKLYQEYFNIKYSYYVYVGKKTSKWKNMYKFFCKKCYFLKKLILLMTADILFHYLNKNKSDSKIHTTTVILFLGHTFKVIELLWPKAKSIKYYVFSKYSVHLSVPIASISPPWNSILLFLFKVIVFFLN